MLDLSLPIHPSKGVRGVPPNFPSGDTDANPPFALTLSRRAPADLMSGCAAPLVLARFATLAEAMQGAIDHAEGIAPDSISPASGAFSMPSPAPDRASTPSAAARMSSILAHANPSAGRAARNGWPPR